MSGKRLHMVRAVNIFSIILFVMCCYYSLCVSSQVSPPGREGALTVVEDPQDDGDHDVEVTLEEEEISDNNEDPLNVFYPTQEWKTVKKGQVIPSGLHVRLNLETGTREAKLMDGDDGSKYWTDGQKEGMVNTKKKHFSQEELKEALKEFKFSKQDIEDPERAENVKKQFKSYEELRTDFHDMNADIRTDQEMVTDLVKIIRHPDISSEDLLKRLTDLEYFVHQIDNALLLSDLGGMDLMVKLLNSTDTGIRTETCLVVGSAMQSNPKVQVAAVDAGMAQQLIRLMSLESSIEVRSKIMYSLSTMIRHFPFAQRKFLELGGLSVLSKLFSETGTDKLRVKAVTLLNDLLIEQDLVSKHANPDDASEMERLQQYASVPLNEAMFETGWCELIPDLLHLPEHDSREKVLQAMTTLLHPCQPSFHRALSTLRGLQAEYGQLAADEKDDADKYFTNINDTISSLISSLSRDEL